VYRKPLTHYVVTESTPAYNPIWEYSQKKTACERLLQKAYESGGFPFTVVRPSHTYSTGRLISSFGWDFTIGERMLAGKEIVVHGDGETLWTLTHAKDFAVGFNGLVGNPAAIGETFHITSDFVYTWNAIHRILAHALGVEAKIVNIPSEVIGRADPDLGPGLLGDKAHCMILDNTKIRRFVPGFQPGISYPEGVRLTLERFREHPELRTFDKKTDALIERLLGIWRTLSFD
jgi:nucleoside-diphosphate-sugar epimerase